MVSGQWSVVTHLFSIPYSALPYDGFLHAVSVRVVGNDDLPGVTPFGLTPGCTLARFQRAKNEY